MGLGLLNMGKPIGPTSMIVFKRLILYYEKNLNVISALVAGVSIGTLTFPEFHPSDSPTSSLINISEAFLVSSTSASTISIMLATMLMFRFEGHNSASRADLALMWVPLVLLDWGIVGFLVGMLTWYTAKSGGVIGRVKGQLAFVGVLMSLAIVVSVRMYGFMRGTGGLGREETEILEKKHGRGTTSQTSDD